MSDKKRHQAKKRRKALKVNPVRNHVALNPLLHKSGVHHKDDIDVARMRERRTQKLKLKKTDWSNQQPD
jgi:hypothetical protein